MTATLVFALDDSVALVASRPSRDAARRPAAHAPRRTGPRRPKATRGPLASRTDPATTGGSASGPPIEKGIDP